MHHLCKTCRLSVQLKKNTIATFGLDVMCDDCEERAIAAVNKRCKRCAKEQNKCAHCDEKINEAIFGKSRK